MEKYTVRIYNANPRLNQKFACETKSDAIKTAKTYTGDIEIKIQNNNGDCIAFKNGDEKNLTWIK
ncbi:MAG: hypothetical protein WCY36_07385 [Candidatus Omnitrophota bacterium]